MEYNEEWTDIFLVDAPAGFRVSVETDPDTGNFNIHMARVFEGVARFTGHGIQDLFGSPADRAAALGDMVKRINKRINEEVPHSVTVPRLYGAGGSPLL